MCRDRKAETTIGSEGGRSALGRSIRIFCHVCSFVCNIWVFCNVMIIRRRPYRCACKGASEGSISLIYIEYAASIPPAHQYLTLIGSAPWSEIPWTEMEGSDFMAKFDQLKAGSRRRLNSTVPMPSRTTSSATLALIYPFWNSGRSCAAMWVSSQRLGASRNARRSASMHSLQA